MLGRNLNRDITQMLKPLVSIILSTSLLACSSDSDESANSVVDVESLDQITGVWDMTHTDSTRGRDESFMVIDNQGSFVVYDYLGDEFNNFKDCYERYSFFGTGVELQQSSDSEFFTSSPTTTVISGVSGTMETNFYYNLTMPTSEELVLSFESSEIKTNHIFDNTRVISITTIDFSVENEMSLVFRVNNIRSSATYTKDSDGNWSAVSENIMHDGFSFDDVVTSVGGFYEGGSMPVIKLSKYSGSQSDFTPVCTDTLDTLKNKRPILLSPNYNFDAL